MSVGYVTVQWNRHKRIYDALLLGGVLLYLTGFVAVGKLVWRGDHAVSEPILLMRALGTCAFLMLHVVLCIGPLARLDRRVLPLLYNRRHLGVATFGVGAAHGLVAIGFYHGFGAIHPFLSLLSTNTGFGSLRTFPFQILGLAALVIMGLMAATSHDFWLRNLSPRVWKTLHMLVYPAYGLLVMHVALGALQSEQSGVYAAIAFAGLLTVTGLHVMAGAREWRRDREPGPVREDWLDAGPADTLAAGRGRVVCGPGRERIAVFRHGDGFSALSNVCAHQGGPLGEGRIIDGCVTCPWHGWQYRPADGQSPPPFTERLPTYRVRISDGRIFVCPHPLPPGTPVEPARVREVSHVR